MRFSQWDVLGAVKAIKDVVQLLCGGVVSSLRMYVKIASNDDLAFVERKTLKVLGKVSEKLAGDITRTRPVEQ